MQKSMENIENIMAKSYNLHKKLKDLKPADHFMEKDAFEVAEEGHEVKKILPVSWPDSGKSLRSEKKNRL